MMRTLMIAVFPVLFCLSANANDSSLINTLAKDWQQIERFNKAGQAKITEYFRILNEENGDFRESRYLTEFNSNQQGYNWKRGPVVEDSFTANRAEVANANYAAALSLNKQNQQFFVESIAPSLASAQQTVSGSVKVPCLTEISAFSVIKLISDRSFQLQQVEELESKLIRCQFVSQFDSGRGPIVKGGEFTVDPTKLHAIVHLRFVMNYPDGDGILIRNYKISEHSIAYGYPESMQEMIIDPADEEKIYGIIETTFSEIGPGDATAEDCRISAFGLPEPAGYGNSGMIRNSLIAVNIVVVICFIVGWLLLRTSRKPVKE